VLGADVPLEVPSLADAAPAVRATIGDAPPCALRQHLLECRVAVDPPCGEVKREIHS
jgi:hypothetical protein